MSGVRALLALVSLPAPRCGSRPAGAWRCRAGPGGVWPGVRARGPGCGRPSPALERLAPEAAGTFVASLVSENPATRFSWGVMGGRGNSSGCVRGAAGRRPERWARAAAGGHLGGSGVAGGTAGPERRGGLPDQSLHVQPPAERSASGPVGGCAPRGGRAGSRAPTLPFSWQLSSLGNSSARASGFQEPGPPPFSQKLSRRCRRLVYSLIATQKKKLFLFPFPSPESRVPPLRLQVTVPVLFVCVSVCVFPPAPFPLGSSRSSRCCGGRRKPGRAGTCGRAPRRLHVARSRSSAASWRRASQKCRFHHG